MQYVVLPDVKNLQIGNFQMYKNNYFNWFFNEDMNLFLGINGLGKTTTIKTLAYAIVGLSNEKNESDLTKEEIRAIEGLESKTEIKEFTEIKEVGIIDKNYFKRYKVVSENPYVIIEFNLKEKVFKLRRNLVNHKLESIEIDGEELIGDLEKKYEEYFEKFSGIELRNFKKILYTLQIRTEEAPSLLFRPTIQHIVLRTLLFGKDFHGKFLSMEKRLRAVESTFRQNKFHLSSLRKIILDKTDNIEDLYKDINNLCCELSDESKKQRNKLEELNAKKNEFEDKEEQLKKEVKKLQDQINNYNDEINKVELEKSELEYTIQEKEDEIISVKKKFYADIYCEDDIYILALNALTERNSCIFCNTNNISEEEIKRIINSTSKGRCSFCNSKIADSIRDESKNLPNKLHSENMDLIKERKILSKSLSQAICRIDKLNLEVKELKLSYEEKVKKILETQKEIGIINTLISNERINNQGVDDAVINKQIDEKKREIDKLCASIEIDKKNYDNISLETFGKIVDYKYIDDEENLDFIDGKKKELLDLRCSYDLLVKEADINIKGIEEKLINKFNQYNILSDFCLHRIVTKDLDRNVSVIKY